MGTERICKYLNRENIRSPTGGRWVRSSVAGILKREAYIGTMVYNKIGRIPGTYKWQTNPESEWIKCEGAFIPIIDKSMFVRAKKICEERAMIQSNDELLTKLQDLYQRHSYVGNELLHKSGLPGVDTFRKRFGSLEEAVLLSQKESAEKAKDMVLEELAEWHSITESSNGSYLLGDHIRLSLAVSFPIIKGNVIYWTFKIIKGKCDITLGLGVIGEDPPSVVKYFVFPNMLMDRDTIDIPIEERGLHEIYECNDLKLLLAGLAN